MDPILGAAANILNPSLAERAQSAREQQLRESERQTDQVRSRPQDIEASAVGQSQPLRDNTGLIPAVRPAELTSNAQFALNNEAAASANQPVEGVPGDSDPLSASANQPLAFSNEPGNAPDDLDPGGAALDARTDVAVRTLSDQPDLVVPANPQDRGDGATARDALRDGPNAGDDLDLADRNPATQDVTARESAADTAQERVLNPEQQDQFDRLSETINFFQAQTPAERAQDSEAQERELGDLNESAPDTATETFEQRLADEGVSTGGNGGPGGPNLPRGSTLSLIA